MTTNTRAVRKYPKAPPIPYFTKFPIKDTRIIPNKGTEDARQAPNILILKTENSPPSPTIDNIKEIKYKTIFFIVNTLEKIFSLLFSFAIIF